MSDQVVAAASMPGAASSCTWIEHDEYWQSSCGESWTFGDGGPVENRMLFCHRCGKSIRALPDTDAVAALDTLPLDKRASTAVPTSVRHQLDVLMRQRFELLQQLVEINRRKNTAYRERNQLVAVLARLFPAGLSRTEMEGWPESLRNCVYVDLPTGQASWHYPDAEAHLFDGLPEYLAEWDGHSDAEKYHRLMELLANPAAPVGAKP